MPLARLLARLPDLQPRPPQDRPDVVQLPGFPLEPSPTTAPVELQPVAMPRPLDSQIPFPSMPRPLFQLLDLHATASSWMLRRHPFAPPRPRLLSQLPDHQGTATLSWTSRRPQSAVPFQMTPKTCLSPLMTNVCSPFIIIQPHVPPRYMTPRMSPQAQVATSH
jgi:hypothetical protein